MSSYGVELPVRVKGPQECVEHLVDANNATVRYGTLQSFDNPATQRSEKKVRDPNTSVDYEVGNFFPIDCP